MNAFIEEKLKIRKAIKMKELKTLLTYLKWNYGFSIRINLRFIEVDCSVLMLFLYIVIYLSFTQHLIIRS